MEFISKKKIKDKLTLVNISDRYSEKVSVRGKTTFIICPFHNDNSLGSCYFYHDSDVFYCEACHTKGDVLKLASGYLGIPLSDMNTLLEKLVEDFSINRDTVLENYTGNPNNDLMESIVLDNSEYDMLLGKAFIKRPTKFKHQNNEDIPTKFKEVSIRSLARTDPEEYDWLMCTLSRIRWQNQMKHKIQLQFDAAKKEKATAKMKKLLSNHNLFSLAQTYCVSPSISCSKTIQVMASPSFDIVNFWNAVIEDNLFLLKKGIQNSKKYEDEIVLRKTLEQREISIQQIINSITAKQKESSLK